MGLLKLLLTVGLWSGSGSVQGAVMLQLADPANHSQTSITVDALSSFELDVWVQGITAPAVHSFNLTIAPLPSGFILNGYTDTLPAGWMSFPNLENQRYGGYNWSGTNITGSATLVRLQFTAGSTSGRIDFADSGPFQNLLDSGDASIVFQTSGVLVNVVPEPASLPLVLCALMIGAIHCRRTAMRQRLLIVPILSR